jgi:hypothetical protein
MIRELTIGRRYRIRLKSPACRGSLEGVLRSTRLPEGMLGNSDGEHCVWLAGESFEWFLRPDEIRSIELLLPRPDDEAVPVLAPRECSSGRRRSWFRPTRTLGRAEPSLAFPYCSSRYRRGGRP